MQAALSLLEAQHIQTGHAIVIDAWCRRLVTAIPRISYNARVALLEASWSHSHVPELRVVSLALLETWPGRIPSVLAEALHRLSPDAFKKLPKLVRWKCCVTISARFRIMLASYAERWFSNVAPSASRSLAVSGDSRLMKGGCTVRRALDPSLYLVLYELIGHSKGILFAAFVEVIWRGVRYDFLNHRVSLYPILFIDILLGLKPQTTGGVRRIAAILDSVAMNGNWDDASLTRLISRMKHMIDANSSVPPCDIREVLEECWKQLQEADSTDLFAFPVTDTIAPGYSKKIKEPMDLSTMRSKILRVHAPYRSIGAFECDIKLMVENCRVYNGPNSILARKARALWKAWLQIKASFQDPREVSEQGVHVRTNYSLTMTKTIHLALALVLIEPCSFAIASAQLREELEACIKLNMLPNQRPRLPKLNYVVAFHSISRHAIGLSTNEESMIDMPKLLESQWIQNRKLLG